MKVALKIRLLHGQVPGNSFLHSIQNRFFRNDQEPTGRPNGGLIRKTGMVNLQAKDRAHLNNKLVSV